MSFANLPDTTAAAPFSSRWASALAGDRDALKQLAVFCQWPVYAWLRASGSTQDEAGSRAENFLARLHSAEPPRDDEKEISRFSDFVLQRLIASAKAGFPEADAGSITPIDRARAERRYKQESSHPPDEIFSRRWSLMILERTLDMLRRELDAKGEGAQFPHLAGFLGFDGGGEEKYAALAPQLGMSVSVLHLAVFNFRKRYREILRTIIADTVRAEGDVDNELTLLLCAAG
jgi:hypothetical protein